MMCLNAKCSILYSINRFFIIKFSCALLPHLNAGVKKILFNITLSRTLRAREEKYLFLNKHGCLLCLMGMNKKTKLRKTLVIYLNNLFLFLLIFFSLLKKFSIEFLNKIFFSVSTFFGLIFTIFK